MNTCTATHRYIVVAGTVSTEFGHPACGAPATHARTVKAAHHDYNITSHYCSAHATRPTVAELTNQTAPATQAPQMDTYAVRGAARKVTGHYRRPGTQELYCGRPAGGKNGIFTSVRGWKMCTRCVRAEARDRADAAAVVEQHRDDLTATEGATQTWHSDWISATATAPTLFDAAGPTEQGALFA